MPRSSISPARPEARSRIERSSWTPALSGPGTVTVSVTVRVTVRSGVSIVVVVVWSGVVTVLVRSRVTEASTRCSSRAGASAASSATLCSRTANCCEVCWSAPSVCAEIGDGGTWISADVRLPKLCDWVSAAETSWAAGWALASADKAGVGTSTVGAAARAFALPKSATTFNPARPTPSRLGYA